jgi:PAS domain S-box-containing protein
MSRRPGFLSDRIVNLSRPAGYAVALGVTAISVSLRLALEPIWGVSLPYITLVPAIMLSGWLGGFGPGVVATLASAVCAAYFWLEPRRTLLVLNADDWLGLFVFVVIGLLISAMNEAWRRANRALAESRQRLDFTLSSIGEAVITTDPDGRVTLLNAVAERLTGWPATQAAGRPLHEVFVVVREQDGGDAASISQTFLVSRDGLSIPIDSNVVPITPPDGRTPGTVMVFRDATERRRIEFDRELQDRLARELAAIVESSDDAIVSKDLEGTIRSWNRGAERMFGYTAAEVIGRSIRIIIPEERWGEEDHVLSLIRSGQKVDHFETIRRRKDGSELAVSLTISPIHSAAGIVIGASKIARDISERKLAEHERAELLAREQSARQEMERASGLKDDFLAVLSHELRTPLNAVLGYSHLLGSGSLPPSRVAHAIAAIQRNARAQARLVESLLDLSRIMAGKLDLNFEEIDLVSVLDAAVDALRPEAEANGIVFEWTSPHEPVSLAGDAARLQQVFWNLFSNAIKFTRGPGRVAIAVAPGPDHVRVGVTDEGQGIEPAFLPHVFERFRQGQDNRSKAGLGLGLALVREMVQAHGGTVVAESAGDGRGSTFSVTLPLKTTAKTIVPHAVRAAGHPGSGVWDREILVVDDERDSREFLALLLVGLGARVRTAGSTMEALATMRQQAPHILLADLGMPDEDGYSLIQRWRDHEQQQQSVRVPAIAVTASATPNDRERAIAAGFDAHVAKPVDSDMLVAAIDRLTATS